MPQALKSSGTLLRRFLLSTSALNFLVVVVFVGAASCTRSAKASNWSVNYLNSLSLDTSVVAASELSGVAYLGPSPVLGMQRFTAVQDSAGQLVTIDVELSATGSLTSAATVSATTLSASLDFEGAAFTNPARNSVFLSEENNPGVQEYDLTTGNQLQSVSIPNVFANRATNRGFESLTRNPAGTTMWTANEEALTVDGSPATATTGTPVRLLELNVDENTVSAGSQYVYEVAPVHGSSTLGSPQSGLVDLVALPDGTLLGLERSVAFTSPLYLNRIYELVFDGATDVSSAPFDSGLIGNSYTPVGKELLWSGAADGSSGQNLEGISLGPRLANGNWMLLGVVDDGDPFSANTIVSFELAASASADFDEDNDVDGFDFLAWHQNFGTTAGATLSNGDADRDGDVDSEDLTLWETALGSIPIAATLQIVPEPGIGALLLPAILVFLLRRSYKARMQS